MPRRYCLWSSIAAPLLLIGGWTLAAAVQPDAFSSTRDTISALAARSADHRWIMTLALVGVGVCHLVTARGLQPLALPARVMLGVGGAATVLVAAFPLPASGPSAMHQSAATVAFASLSLWPALWRQPGSTAVRPPATVMIPATAILAALVLLFTAALATGTVVGLAERVAAGAQSLWPLATVLLLRRPTTR
ncbi:DUF998 domain-containing protein [Dactylosporangium matsuzakiense]|uniref:Membrane protein n=1 Tax=Dactylosporangium matsuzakiense TaxID=53360 RepID=A0A9W6KFQ1_9ACTN|nr:DUF998 domain-containing protein [Dactylosporangium matsuzakiense]UWZ46619.1 DUF998 domain-containing protein [Dactylosporangium matsuzakiense]GLL01247.1 membrane protein [Dactylosporangium matsuzakiense]